MFLNIYGETTISERTSACYDFQVDDNHNSDFRKGRIEGIGQEELTRLLGVIQQVISKCVEDMEMIQYKEIGYHKS